MKLFMFYIGGNCGNSNVELHDVRFSIGNVPEDCYDDLRRQWWGDPNSLHLDSWGIVEQADGYDVALTDVALTDIALTTSPQNNAPLKLFFVNLGGYDPREFGELHKNVLIAAPDIKSAKQKALKQVNEWVQPHKDRIFEIEQAVDLTALTGQYGWTLSLKPATAPRPFVFQCLYQPLG
jgi:hypothetical protein